jgi:hypothetical protein
VEGGAPRLTTVFLCVCVSTPCFAQKPSDSLGHLLKIVAGTNSLEPGRENYKPNYLFKIRTGETVSIALYHLGGRQQGYVDAFNDNTDVPSRISGKNLFLKTPDGHELKLLLCDVKHKATVCGDEIFPGME